MVHEIPQILVGRDMFWSGYCGPGWGYWPWHGPIFFMFVALIVIVFLSRIFSGRKEAGVNTYDSSQDILRQRFASGEISEDEFLQRKNTLSR